MPTTTYPRDRFDEVPETDRVGAHRAENPRMRGWVVLLWAALATIVLIAVGIFGTLLASGRIELAPSPAPTAEPVTEVAPVVDPTFDVMILNATPESGLATQLKEVVVTAGWADDKVSAGEAGSQDFPTTTVFYVDPAHEAAAAGLADVIGGAAIEQSDAYPPTTEGVPQLTVVIGLDRTAAGQTPAPTP
ncbi:LytR C-terminal domain-containing protein [Microbacterium hibisci]|uniref:LytR C-terminal domain-containing protein n=1 Tax=Microbacterium hibisci TaxID=2036000 RepID=UPI00194074DA|nr:LytR C-terminal domain-containing protein [Microbacterium hibisci]